MKTSGQNPGAIPVLLNRKRADFIPMRKSKPKQKISEIEALIEEKTESNGLHEFLYMMGWDWETYFKKTEPGAEWTEEEKTLFL